MPQTAAYSTFTDLAYPSIVNSITHRKTCLVGFWFKVGSCNDDTGDNTGDQRGSYNDGYYKSDCEAAGGTAEACGLYPPEYPPHEGHPRRHNLYGITHFLEHIIFKRTENYDAIGLSKRVEKHGGYINAYTSKQDMCIYINILPEFLHIAFEVLAEILLRNNFTAEDVEKERQIILSEIKEDDEAPEIVVENLLFKTIAWNHEVLKQSILGDKNSVSRISFKDLKDHFTRYLHPQNGVLVVNGNCKVAEVRELISKYFNTSNRACKDFNIAPAIDNSLSKDTITSELFTVKTAEAKLHQSLEQAHIIYASPILINTKLEHYQFMLLKNILGENSSSRLFKQVREESSMGYNSYAFYHHGHYHSHHNHKYHEAKNRPSHLQDYGGKDYGVFGVYAGICQDKIAEYHHLQAQIWQAKIEEDEYVIASMQLQTATQLMEESLMNYAEHLAHAWLFYRESFDPQAETALIKSITKSKLEETLSSFEINYQITLT